MIWKCDILPTQKKKYFVLVLYTEWISECKMQKRQRTKQDKLGLSSVCISGMHECVYILPFTYSNQETSLQF